MEEYKNIIDIILDSRTTFIKKNSKTVIAKPTANIRSSPVRT